MKFGLREVLSVLYDSVANWIALCCREEKLLRES